MTFRSVWSSTSEESDPEGLSKSSVKACHPMLASVFVSCKRHSCRYLASPRSPKQFYEGSHSEIPELDDAKHRNCNDIDHRVMFSWQVWFTIALNVLLQINQAMGES